MENNKRHCKANCRYFLEKSVGCLKADNPVQEALLMRDGLAGKDCVLFLPMQDYPSVAKDKYQKHQEIGMSFNDDLLRVN